MQSNTRFRRLSEEVTLSDTNFDVIRVLQLMLVMMMMMTIVTM